MWLKTLISFFYRRKAKPKALPPPGEIVTENEIQTDTPEQNNPEMTKENNTSRKDEAMPPEFDYLGQLIAYRLDAYFPSKEGSMQQPRFPPLESWHLPMVDFIIEHNLSSEEATLLLIAVTPHIQPDLFNQAIERKLPDARKASLDFPLIGGVKGKNSRFFLPTGQTALFLIGGDDLDKRLRIQQLFDAEHLFAEKKILWLENMRDGEPAVHGRMIVSFDYLELFTYGIHRSPQFSMTFPAKKIAPSKDPNPPSFDQLVIPEELHDQITELKSWLKYNEQLMKKYGMQQKLRKGYRTLFYGPPGTGKTFTAQILGNDLNKEVFKVDLSMVVSKYIGETEKNLELLFARAEDKNWILFFDEADALFGKRTNVRDAHDKYANQEVSYLLQRIEDYNGLVILATNMKNNIDEAFIRRFNSILKFPFPDAAQRAEIWKKALPQNALYRKKLLDGDPPKVREAVADIPDAVKKYELTGGNIINVVQYACIKGLEALDKKNQEVAANKVEQFEGATVVVGSSQDKDAADENMLTIYVGDVLDGIKRELLKEGKPFSL